METAESAVTPQESVDYAQMDTNPSHTESEDTKPPEDVREVIGPRTPPHLSNEDAAPATTSTDSATQNEVGSLCSSLQHRLKLKWPLGDIAHTFVFSGLQ